MPKSPKDWSPGEDKLTDVLLRLHRHLSDAGVAEARLVDDLLVEILDPEGSPEDYVSSLDELIGWAEIARKRILPLTRKKGRS